MRPVHFVQGWFPRIVDGSRAPDYTPGDGASPMKPLGYIPQVNHTYAYWDLNYGAQPRRARFAGGHAPACACACLVQR